MVLPRAFLPYNSWLEGGWFGLKSRDFSATPLQFSCSFADVFSRVTLILPGILSLCVIAIGVSLDIPVQAESTDPDRDLSLTDLTYIGSHNSYKKPIEGKLLRWITGFDPKTGESLDYEHPSIPRQLNFGLRLFELDLFFDPAGGRYQSPLGARWPFSDQGLTSQERLSLKAPGFKVFHVQDIDFRSHCLSLRTCLQHYLSFSNKNPGHVPIVISFNLKTQVIDLPGFTDPLPFDQSAFLALEAEILSILPRHAIFTPKALQGPHPSLAEAVETDGWPRLASLRDHFILVLDESEDKLIPYSELKRQGQAGIFFKTPDLGHADAAVLILNDPVARADDIRKALSLGYLVRTRADANTLEARQNDTRRRDAAFKSGAQLISTDYYLPNPVMSEDYRVQFEDGQYLRNPRTSDSRLEPL